MSGEAERVGKAPPERGWDEFEPLYDEHHERLYRVALLLCHGSEAMATDAVAETYLRMYPAWADGRVRTFFAEARQVLVTHVLGQHRKGLATRYAGSRDGSEDGLRPVDEAIADAGTMFHVLEHLEAQERTAVVLRYFEDLSYDQIASTMGVPARVAKANVTAGLARMRTLMGEDQT